MTLATYKKIDTAAKLICSWGLLAAVYATAYFSRTLWVVIVVAVLGLLPYLVGYNIFVRGWLRRKVVE
jgi:hypothetical protein